MCVSYTHKPHCPLVYAPQLFLVGGCVLIHPGSTVQLITGYSFSLVITLFSSIAEPFQNHGHIKFSLLCNFSLVMVFFFSLVLKMGVLSEDVKDSDLLSDELQALYIFDPAVLSAALLFALLASVIVAAVLAVYQVYQSTRKAARAAAAEREASIARGRLTHPPSHKWELRQGNRYCMFLSHFKEEAGSDARYLSDLIRRKTGCAAYLDSNDLVDLRTLFNEGEHTLTLHMHVFLHARARSMQAACTHASRDDYFFLCGRRSQVGRPRHPCHKGRLDAAVVPTGDVGGGSE